MLWHKLLWRKLPACDRLYKKVSHKLEAYATHKLEAYATSTAQSFSKYGFDFVNFDADLFQRVAVADGDGLVG